MKVLLVDPPWFTLLGVRSATLSLGLISIAKVLKEKGHNVKIWNADVYKFSTCKVEQSNIFNVSILKEHPVYDIFKTVVKDYKPDVVGITCMTAEYPSVLVLSQISKKIDKNIKVILGGIHPTLVPYEILKEKSIDYLSLGESEYTIMELFEYFSSHNINLSEIKGLAYREKNKIIVNKRRELIEDLDLLPSPDLDDVMDKHNHYPVDFAGVISSRGCPFLCTYCASKELWTRKVRYRSIDKLINDIEILYKSGVRVFRINDDAFTIKRSRVEEFCSKVSKYKNIRWSCDTRGELLDKKLLSLMRKSGCYQINIGVESGSERIQKMIRKNLNVEKVKRTIRHAFYIGIKTTAYFMVGFPSETKEDIKDSIRLARKIRADYVLFSTYTPYPGTEIWNILRSSGKIPGEIDYSKFHHHSANMNFSKLSKDEFNKQLNIINNVVESNFKKRRFLFILRHPFIFFKDRNIIKKQQTKKMGQQYNK